MDSTPACIRKDDALNVLLVESRRLFRECLENYLNAVPGITAIAISRTIDWVQRPEDHFEPDVILMGISEGERLPADLAPIESLPSVPIVVLSAERPPSQVVDLLKRGVKGFVPTSLDFAVTVQVLRLVKAGGIFVPSTCLSAVPSQDLYSPATKELFTGRQKQVIEALRLGKPNKIIAYELRMCESTVKVHIRTIMKKLKAKNRTEVAYLYTTMAGKDDSTRREGELGECK